MTARRKPYRLGGTRIGVRLGAGEAEPLRAYAERRSLPLSEAARRLIRISLTGSNPILVEEDDKGRGGLLEELALLNLIVSEQTLKLLETITPRGPGTADDLLLEATQSIQRRLAHGVGSEAPRP